MNAIHLLFAIWGHHDWMSEELETISVIEIPGILREILLKEIHFQFQRAILPSSNRIIAGM